MLNPAAKPAIFSAVLALALYAVTLGGTYVYDDRYIVLQDPRIGDVAAWKEFWTKDYFNGGADNLYRPLVSMTYAIQSKLHGRSDNRAWGFHLVNLLLHAAACAAVAEMARRVTRSPSIALIAGLLFAAHPIHVEAVANIVGRAELMCGLAMFAAIVLFLRPLTVPRAFAISGCFVAALLSKEQGMLLPLLLLAAIPLRPTTKSEPDIAQRDDTTPPPLNPPVGDTLSYASPHTPRPSRLTIASLWLILLTCWTLAGYVYLRENTLHLKFWWDRSFLDDTINPLILSTGRDRWLLPISLFGRYVALLIAPLHLLPDYGGDVIGSRIHFTDPYFYIGIASGIALILACVIALIRRRWATLFCLLGVALLTGMVINFLTLIGTNFAERLMYIPSAFACILAAMAIAKLPRKPAIVITAALVALFSLRTITYAAQWNDPVQLFERGIAREPKAIRLYLLLSEEYERRHDVTRARATLAQARDLSPGYYRGWLKSATLELAAGDFDAAMRFARQGQKLKPTQTGTTLFDAIDAARAATRPATTAP